MLFIRLSVSDPPAPSSGHNTPHLLCVLCDPLASSNALLNVVYSHHHPPNSWWASLPILHACPVWWMSPAWAGASQPQFTSIHPSGSCCNLSELSIKTPLFSLTHFLPPSPPLPLPLPSCHQTITLVLHPYSSLLPPPSKTPAPPLMKPKVSYTEALSASWRLRCCHHTSALWTIHFLGTNCICVIVVNSRIKERNNSVTRRPHFLLVTDLIPQNPDQWVSPASY